MTENDPITVRAFLGSRIDDLAALTDNKFDERDKAIIIAAASVDRRLRSLNDLHTTMNNERGQFVARDLFDQRSGVVDTRLSEYDKRVSSLENFAKYAESQSQRYQPWQLWAAGAALAVLIVAVNVIVNLASVH